MKKQVLFNIWSIFLIVIFCFFLVPKTFQNDTYYTIKIGETIANNGIDMMDHFSFHENLEYTYPHWLYDLLTYKFYSIGGFTGVYVLTIIFTIILGITIYYVLNYKCKNNILSFFITIATLFLLSGFITARAQLVTFTLFLLEYLLINKILEKRNIFILYYYF